MQNSDYQRRQYQRQMDARSDRQAISYYSGEIKLLGDFENLIKKIYKFIIGVATLIGAFFREIKN